MDVYGDFCGFTFNGRHSSELGFIRVSDGNRYSENILPAFQDKTVAVPGGDGTYFFDSYYTNKTFTINIAFDSMTESQLRELRQVFNAKAVGELIFDETPYKAYTAKVQNPPQLKYICFDESNEDYRGSSRVYKGEGTINFIAYYPYARSVHKYLSEFDSLVVSNQSEWAESSGMLEEQGDYDTTPSTVVKLYNPGDVAVDFKAYYTGVSKGSFPSNILNLHALLSNNTPKESEATLVIDAISSAISSDDIYICVNTYTNLLEGCDENKVPTGTLYNNYISAGDFFKIPINQTTNGWQLSTTASCDSIEYNYLYY